MDLTLLIIVGGSTLGVRRDRSDMVGNSMLSNAAVELNYDHFAAIPLLVYVEECTCVHGSIRLLDNPKFYCKGCPKKALFIK